MEIKVTSLKQENPYGPEFDAFLAGYCLAKNVTADKLPSEEFDVVCSMFDNKRNIARAWWENLPIQNLEDMDDSWVGYVRKHFPGRQDIYHLTDDEVLTIYQAEHKS